MRQHTPRCQIAYVCRFKKFARSGKQIVRPPYLQFASRVSAGRGSVCLRYVVSHWYCEISSPTHFVGDTLCNDAAVPCVAGQPGQRDVGTDSNRVPASALIRRPCRQVSH